MAANAQDDVKVQQIRRAAHTLFLRHGFAGVSTAALAKEAGVSKETLYSRFPNKDAVLEMLGEFDPGVPLTIKPLSVAGFTRSAAEQTPAPS